MLPIVADTEFWTLSYNNLWQVEESFRITKHDLKIRPIYHWSPKRVKAHLAISFTAYMLTKVHRPTWDVGVELDLFMTLI